MSKIKLREMESRANEKSFDDTEELLTAYAELCWRVMPLLSWVRRAAVELRNLSETVEIEFGTIATTTARTLLAEIEDKES